MRFNSEYTASLIQAVARCLFLAASCWTNSARLGSTGNSKGVVHLVNIRYDKLLFSLRHEPKYGNKKPVRITSMSFRTDGSALQYEIAPLAVGRSDGTITVWDLSPPNEDDDEDDFGACALSAGN